MSSVEPGQNQHPDANSASELPPRGMRSARAPDRRSTRVYPVARQYRPSKLLGLCCANHRNCLLSFEACQTSSESIKAKNSPRACSMPVLRAAAAPPFCTLRMRRTRGSATNCASSTNGSGEPSSTMINSMSVPVCASTDRAATVPDCCRMKIGMMTEQRGTQSHPFTTGGVPCVWKLSIVLSPQAWPFFRSVSVQMTVSQSGAKIRRAPALATSTRLPAGS
jgi:hypothetical protein